MLSMMYIYSLLSWMVFGIVILAILSMLFRPLFYLGIRIFPFYLLYRLFFGRRYIHRGVRW